MLTLPPENCEPRDEQSKCWGGELLELFKFREFRSIHGFSRIDELSLTVLPNR